MIEWIEQELDNGCLRVQWKATTQAEFEIALSMVKGLPSEWRMFNPKNKAWVIQPGEGLENYYLSKKSLDQYHDSEVQAATLFLQSLVVNHERIDPVLEDALGRLDVYGLDLAAVIQGLWAKVFGDDYSDYINENRRLVKQIEWRDQKIEALKRELQLVRDATSTYGWNKIGIQLTDMSPTLIDPEITGVYFLYSKTNDLIKIGMSKASIVARWASLCAEHKEWLRILGYIQTDDPRGLESKLHKLFKSLRVRGEWFRPGDKLIAHISLKAITVDTLGGNDE